MVVMMMMMMIMLNLVMVLCSECIPMIGVGEVGEHCIRPPSSSDYVNEYKAKPFSAKRKSMKRTSVKQLLMKDVRNDMIMIIEVGRWEEDGQMTDKVCET